MKKRIVTAVITACLTLCAAVGRSQTQGRNDPPQYQRTPQLSETCTGGKARFTTKKYVVEFEIVESTLVVLGCIHCVMKRRLPCLDFLISMVMGMWMAETISFGMN